MSCHTLYLIFKGSLLPPSFHSQYFTLFIDMIEDALLKDYFKLTPERKVEVMEVVCEKLHDAYILLETTTGKKHAKEVLEHTLSTEMNKSLQDENYEYAEIINQLIQYMTNAVD